MSATALKQRLRADLKAAMQARAAEEVGLLRTLIAALDNAEAVAGSPERSIPRAFGDPSGEVERLALDGEAVAALLAKEIETRLAAAADYAAHGRDGEAARLRDETATIRRYLA